MMSDRGDSSKGWLMGILFAVCLAALGWSQAANASRLSELERTMQARGERLAVLEEMARQNKDAHARIESQLTATLALLQQHMGMVVTGGAK